MAYIPDTPEALQAVIRDAVTAAVRDEVPRAVRGATRKPYLTRKELMELTGWSPRTVSYRMSARAIPFVRQGRTVLFPTDEVDAYLRAGYVSAKRPASTPQS